MYVFLLVNAIWWLEIGRKPREQQLPAGLWQAFSPFPGAWGTSDVSEAVRCLEHPCLQELMPGAESLFPAVMASPISQPGLSLGSTAAERVPSDAATPCLAPITPLSHSTRDLGGETE